MKKKMLFAAGMAGLLSLSLCSTMVWSEEVQTAEKAETESANIQSLTVSQDNAATQNTEASDALKPCSCPPDCACKDTPDEACKNDCKCGCKDNALPPKKMTPEERRAEFEKRMNLTPRQKAKLETIKAEEQKKLEPIRKKMQKKHEEMKELMKSEAEIRKSSMDKFEAVLTPEQKEELKKMKAEIHEKMKHEFGRPHGFKGPHEFRGPEFGPKPAPGMDLDEPPMRPGMMQPAPEAPEK